jgi:hypothetical protein
VDSDWNPVALDRQLARAFAAWRGWRERQHQGSEADDDALSLFRPITGLELFRTLNELPEYDPLRLPLQRWVYRLAEQRINHGVLTQLARERQREREHSDAPGRVAVSRAEMLRRVLSDAPRAEIWMRLFLEDAHAPSAVVVNLWQRRREIARRMGLDGPGHIESPASNIAEVARQFAATAGERIRELRIKSPSAFVQLALGRDVPGSWPARLSPNRLLDYFREADLLHSLDLRAPDLPRSYGAASFGRALGILGGAWLEALAPLDQPFVIAHDPYGLKRHEASALFALLPLNARFLHRHLEIPPHALADVQRRLAQIWLLDLATAAYRVRLRPHALGGEQEFREAFTELGHRDLNLSLPEQATGVLFPLGVEDEQAFVGRLLAARRELALLDEHDEDWYRNPRAVEQLRAEAHRPPQTRADPEDVVAALALVTKRLESLLR